MTKILLVEDDNNLREIYGARLEAEGYEIAYAQDGEEALSVAVKEKPDLIVSDVMMPKISGFDMLDILRNTPETANTRVIMMTALSQAEDKARADKLGADKYLVKSQVTLEDVVKTVSEVLGKDDQQADAIANPEVPEQTQVAVEPAQETIAPIAVAAAPGGEAVVNTPVVAQQTELSQPEPQIAYPQEVAPADAAVQNYSNQVATPEAQPAAAEPYSQQPAQTEIEQPYRTPAATAEPQPEIVTSVPDVTQISVPEPTNIDNQPEIQSESVMPQFTATQTDDQTAVVADDQTATIDPAVVPADQQNNIYSDPIGQTVAPQEVAPAPETEQTYTQEIPAEVAPSYTTEEQIAPNAVVPGDTNTFTTEVPVTAPYANDAYGVTSPEIAQPEVAENQITTPTPEQSAAEAPITVDQPAVQEAVDSSQQVSDNTATAPPVDQSAFTVNLPETPDLKVISENVAIPTSPSQEREEAAEAAAVLAESTKEEPAVPSEIPAQPVMGDPSYGPSLADVLKEAEDEIKKEMNTSDIQAPIMTAPSFANGGTINETVAPAQQPVDESPVQPQPEPTPNLDQATTPVVTPPEPQKPIADLTPPPTVTQLPSTPDSFQPQLVTPTEQLQKPQENTTPTVPKVGGIHEENGKKVINPINDVSTRPDINALLAKEQQNAAITNPMASTVVQPTNAQGTPQSAPAGVQLTQQNVPPAPAPVNPGNIDSISL